MSQNLVSDLENEYQKKEHLQHIYDLPDTYTGSIEFTEQQIYVMNDSRTHMEVRNVNYVPGFFKIFDEILVNAMDHRQRDKNVKNIKVSMSLGFSEISVWNDGKGIDVERHPTYNDYIVEMLFGQLLTSTNYEKDQKRVTGGKNGYGAKLTNIFSKKFTIETVDAVRKKKYTQIFENNMRTKHDPVITNCNLKPYTMITFLPDYIKFECVDGITSDIYKLFEKRVYDMAGICPDDMNIFLNNEKIKVRGFEKYIQLYISELPTVCFTDDKQERWKVGLALSPNCEYMEVSFVNGIWTMKGGKHTEHVLSQVIDRLKDLLTKNPKTKGKNIKNSTIKDQIWLFVNCIIENPSFTSQTKEELSSKVSQFGSRWECCEKMVEKFYKSGFLDRILETCNEQEEKNMKKTDGNKKSQIRVPKLEDANFAGTRRSHECTLILTEGDSAKTSALSGLSIHGPSFRDYYGVFPLKGKFLNVRDASTAQILNNEEVKNLKKILGLQQGKEYTSDNIKDLRYGSVSLMTDQDSVVGDTPILLSNSDVSDMANISISYIQDIFDESNSLLLPTGKQVCELDQAIYTWTSSGWTKIVKVIRHKTAKKIYRVITNKGIVDVTEDHSMLDEYENKIRPCDITADTNLLYSFPFKNTESADNSAEISDEIIDDFEKECNIVNSYDIFAGENRYDCTSFVNDTQTIREIKYKSGNSNVQIMYEFNKYNAQLKYLIEVIKGNIVQISYDEQNNAYILMSEKRSRKSNVDCKCKIIKITELNNEFGGYVYDLETENHQFQAGIGELIVHNTDGSHIKGLLLNFFHHFFPSLLKVDGFLKTYITPIVRGFKGNSDPINFYTIADYENFKSSDAGASYSFKYYKGLGTSSTHEMQEYFKKMQDITINYEYVKDAEYDINMAFKKSMASERKEWLKTYNPNDTIVYSCAKKHKVLPLNEFIHKDLKHFSNADNIRSIPNIMDGLKPSQRKVLYGTLLKCGAANTSIKVAQLSGYISEKTCYHHGEMSLEQTIVSMAQQFVGKNNVNWFAPLGMFGTRLAGGKDHASSRYIFTKINPITYKTFRKEDEKLLKYLDDDGETIEPEIYFPVVPVILINGSEGIGTGYSTSIPSFNPIQVAEECIKYASGETITNEWTPWYNGFKGVVHRKNILLGSDEISSMGDDTSVSGNSNLNSFVSEGVFSVSIVEKKITVTELPIGMWTESYKEFLEEQISLFTEFKKKYNTSGTSSTNSSSSSKTGDEKSKSGSSSSSSSTVSAPRFPIINYVNRCTDKDVHFEIFYESENGLFDKEPSNFRMYCLVKLKLYSKINISNMYLYVGNELVKFGSVREILEHFCAVRLEKYIERKDLILKEWRESVLLLREKIRFLELVITGDLILFKKPKCEIYELLKSHHFQLKDDSYDYCIKMPIESFTLEKIVDLRNMMDQLNLKISDLENKTANQIWIEELKEWITQIHSVSSLSKETNDPTECSSSKKKISKLSVEPKKKKTTK